MSIFDYTHPDVPDGCEVLISPSMIGQFFTNPKTWYESTILGIETFKGNTASSLGTVCHYCYKCVEDGQHPDKEKIKDDVTAFALNQNDPNPDISIGAILSTYPPIVECVVNEYILKQQQTVIAECPISYNLGNNIYLAGTFDRYEPQTETLVDFKTVSKKPSEEIPFGYRLQMLAYAYMLELQGKPVNRIRLVYGITPLKTIGARCIVVTEDVTDESRKQFTDSLDLITETILLCKKHPEYTHLLFKSMELKK